MKFKIFGIEFEFQYVAVLILTVALLFDKSHKVSFCLLGAVIHELGHIVAMLCFSIKPRAIRFRIFDVAIEENTEKTSHADFFITLAGPIFNLIFAGLFCYINKDFCLCNIALCVFNLLPVDTFDGGHALFLLLTKRLSINTTYLILKIFTLVILIPLFVFGIIVLCYSKYNYSLLIISLYLLAILFIK